MEIDYMNSALDKSNLIEFSVENIIAAKVRAYNAGKITESEFSNSLKQLERRILLEMQEPEIQPEGVDISLLESKVVTVLLEDIEGMIEEY
jgi:hypothetical protein